jgi:pimeloyl-ACP methyl ester carboxylesterase
MNPNGSERRSDYERKHRPIVESDFRHTKSVYGRGDLRCKQNLPLGCRKFLGKVFAWKTKPSWFLVTTKDRVIPAELAKSMAHKLNAETVEVQSCHAVVVAHPEEVSALILKASQADKVSH